MEKEFVIDIPAAGLWRVGILHGLNDNVYDVYPYTLLIDTNYSCPLSTVYN